MINIIFLLKFGSQENIQRLYDKGEIYMNTIKLFQEFDKDWIGDIFEGTFNIKNIKNAKITLKIPGNPITLNSTKLQLRLNYKGPVGNIYSTYAISNLLLKRKAKHRIDKRMSKFGSHCLIIKNVEKFRLLILEKLQQLEYDSSHNIVRYYDYSKNNHELTLFNKTHKLSYQKEHRIIAYSDIDKPIKFEIGCMHNYSEMHTSEDIIKKTVIDYH